MKDRVENTYVEVTVSFTEGGKETFAVEVKGMTPKPGVDPVDFATVILPMVSDSASIVGAKFLTREEYDADYGDEPDTELLEGSVE